MSPFYLIFAIIHIINLGSPSSEWPRLGLGRWMSAVDGEELSHAVRNIVVQWCDSPHQALTIEYFVSRYSRPLLEEVRVGFMAGRAALWRSVSKGSFFFAYHYAINTSFTGVQC